MESYHERLRLATGRLGALCAGIDPHPGLLAQWGLPNDAAGVERFALTVVEALADTVAVVKPQSALFEAQGSAGVAALERTIAAAREAGLLVIVDAKRGDIGSTMAAYAEAYLGGGPLSGDAVTLSPYLGFGSLAPALDAARRTGRGVYVLARTSNPEGACLQSAVTATGETVAQSIVDAATAANQEGVEGVAGLVVGATHATTGLDLGGFAGSILAPGVGAQGGTMAGVRALFGDSPALVLPSASREILSAGPDPALLRDAARRLLGA
ncbi:MAG: orotidine-5'-phosphate decarboxylase [Propionibacteriaceae bacterium]|jgi:orotidine-5'-phosphate decarboxylase|nr:orotidine-5'-phosphate decarboxylase [Propionibacteriaceae bacterium]